MHTHQKHDGLHVFINDSIVKKVTPLFVILLQDQRITDRWMGGWMGGWVDGQRKGCITPVQLPEAL